MYASGRCVRVRERGFISSVSDFARARARAREASRQADSACLAG